MNDYYHTADGIVSLVNFHLRDGLRKVDITNRPDRIELFEAIGRFCHELRMELDSCEMLATYQDYHDVKWGHRSRGVDKLPKKYRELVDEAVAKRHL